MKMEVELISKELIKPSSPTPPHLRHLRLSFLDQIQLPVSMPFVFFYSQNSQFNNLQICNLLKKSLSQVLTLFYPLAGRVRNNSYIDCNDEGVLFAQAKANCLLSDILRNRNPHHNNKLIPLQPDEAGDLAAFSQITFFNCGGLSISFAISHKLGDALSKFIFLNSWAAFARGNNTHIYIPPFGSANLFPPKNLSGMDPRKKWISKDKIVTKVFAFDSSIISALKAKYSVDGGERLSRVEALAVFIWSRFMATTQAKEGNNNKLHIMLHTVNLRPRMEPPLPKQSFGNLFTVAMADMDAKEDECYGIVRRIKDAIRNVNMDYVKKLQKSNEHLNFLKERSEKVAKGEGVSFTSLCNFPIYEANFGWGIPEWVASTRMVFKNLIILLDAKEGQGIEAWISLKEEDMTKFEIDNQLLSHISSTPNGINPLHAQSRL